MGYGPGPCRPGGAATGQPLRAGKLRASPTKHRRPEASDTDLAVAASVVVGGVGTAEVVEEPTQTIYQDPQCRWPDVPALGPDSGSPVNSSGPINMGYNPIAI